MSDFMVVMFGNSKAEYNELVLELEIQQNEGNYAAPDMSQFYFNACPSGLILISSANSALGRKLKDDGYTVRQQIWRAL